MEQRYKAIFTLPAVRFAPFLAAGMLIAYFAGKQSVRLAEEHNFTDKFML